MRGGLFSPTPITGAAACMGNGNDHYGIVCQWAKNQHVGEAVDPSSDQGTLSAESAKRRSSSSIREASSNATAESSAGSVSSNRDASVNRSLSGSLSASARIASDVNATTASRLSVTRLMLHAATAKSITHQGTNRPSRKLYRLCRPTSMFWPHDTGSRLLCSDGLALALPAQNLRRPGWTSKNVVNLARRTRKGRLSAF